jgi:hypothetical protein
MPATGDCSIHSALCTEFEIFSLSWLGTLSLPSAVESKESNILLFKMRTEKAYQCARGILLLVARSGPHERGLVTLLVGAGPNVIQNMSTYFTEGKADPSKTNTLAVNVAEFLDQVNGDANAITAWEISGEK